MAWRRRAGGFTLIELMVCIAIFFLIALAVQQIFNMVVTLWRNGDARLQMFQDGRFCLDVIATHMRSSIRPGYSDWDRDGDMDATDTGTTGCRFVGANNAQQAAASTITASSQGIAYGYLQSDAIAFFTVGYSSNNDESDIVGYAFGCSNALPSTLGEPCIYWAKIGCSNLTYENNPGVNRRVIQPDVSDMKPHYMGTPASATRTPTFYNVRDMNILYYDGTVTSGSESLFWDSAVKGKLPTIVKIYLQMQDGRGISDPIWISTYTILEPRLGI